MCDYGNDSRKPDKVETFLVEVVKNMDFQIKQIFGGNTINIAMN